MTLVSIIVLNWKQADRTIACINSLLDLTYQPKEIIFVDNGSQDGSVEKVKKKFKSKIRTVALPKNTGYTGGNNAGVQAAKGEFCLIINNDTLAPRNLLTKVVPLMKKNVGIVKVSSYQEKNKVAFNQRINSSIVATTNFFGDGIPYQTRTKNNQNVEQLPLYTKIA
jgi:GT2 family glycosyltransferase